MLESPRSVLPDLASGASTSLHALMEPLLFAFTAPPAPSTDVASTSPRTDEKKAVDAADAGNRRGCASRGISTKHGEKWSWALGRWRRGARRSLACTEYCARKTFGSSASVPPTTLERPMLPNDGTV